MTESSNIDTNYCFDRYINYYKLKMKLKDLLIRINYFDSIFYLLLILTFGLFINEKFSNYLAEKNIKSFAAENPEHSVNDLLKIRQALEGYHNKNGSYPISDGYSGILTCGKKSSAEWIEGLVPVYLEYLPNNLEKSRDCAEQYLYVSNGNDYKLIHNNPKDCPEIKNKVSSLIDPQRICWAYGFWTLNAFNF